MNDERKVDGYKCLCTSDFTGKNCQGKVFFYVLYFELNAGLQNSYTFIPRHSFHICSKNS